jgi:hypothetical protein
MDAKKMVLLVVMVGLVCIMAVAEEPFSLQAGGGLYYNAVPLPEGPLGFLAVLGNLRGGGYLNLTYALVDSLSAGGELGLQYVQARADAFDAWTSLVDIQVRALAKAGLGGMGIAPYAGLLWKIAATPDGTTTATSVEPGVRTVLGSWYLEAGYALSLRMDTPSHLRFGVGRRLELIRF